MLLPIHQIQCCTYLINVRNQSLNCNLQQMTANIHSMVPYTCNLAYKDYYN